MGIRTEGFDEFSRKLEDLARRAEDLEGEREVPLSELFPPSFVSVHTDFPDMETMLAKSPWDVETVADFERIPGDEWERYITERTRFASWEEMQERALAE